MMVSESVMQRPFLPPTPEQVSTWRAEKVELEKVIVDGQKKLAALSKMLEAAEFWTGIDSAEPANEFGLESPVESDNFMGTVERLANEADRPLKRSILKAELRRLGFGDKQLGNYFYSVVKRLKDAKRITVTDDGDLWRKP
jgi:hypothetical protein